MSKESNIRFYTLEGLFKLNPQPKGAIKMETKTINGSVFNQDDIINKCSRIDPLEWFRISQESNAIGDDFNQAELSDFIGNNLKTIWSEVRGAYYLNEEIVLACNKIE